MTPDDADLRDTARSLAWLYRLLDDRKFAPPPPKDSRIMRPTPGPADPVPLWILDAEDRLLEERREEDENGYPLPLAQVVPGGLLVWKARGSANPANWRAITTLDKVPDLIGDPQ